MNNRIPKKVILKGEQNFEQIFTKGRFLKSSYIIVVYIDDPQLLNNVGELHTCLNDSLVLTTYKYKRFDM